MVGKNLSKPILCFNLILIFSFPQLVMAEKPFPIAAESCSTCHGKQGSIENAIPSIDSLSQTELVEILNKYKNGELVGTIMNRLAAGLSDEDIFILAKYFGT